ncbi:PilZ domain-containing protein [uncultured Halopseudomonas sp.]|uniref:PilZ domain-containing protein n=1 Tax=uncultured Halopseudomonas sp. TaxID=2901193 RepID=UPI0030EB990A|tara:strand:+ start:1422 stop:1727 length:306 start_codon:yes stop_codon:yes gene_type:complete
MSFHDQQYREKRDFIRMKVEARATLTLQDSGEVIQADCQDLSSQGVQVVLDRPLPENTHLSLSIPSPTPGLQGLEADGQVMRCEAIDNGQFIVGVYFNTLK